MDWGEMGSYRVDLGGKMRGYWVDFGEWGVIGWTWGKMRGYWVDFGGNGER